MLEPKTVFPYLIEYVHNFFCVVIEVFLNMKVHENHNKIQIACTMKWTLEVKSIFFYLTFPIFHANSHIHQIAVLHVWWETTFLYL